MACVSPPGSELEVESPRTPTTTQSRRSSSVQGAGAGQPDPSRRSCAIGPRALDAPTLRRATARPRPPRSSARGCGVGFGRTPHRQRPGCAARGDPETVRRPASPRLRSDLRISRGGRRPVERTVACQLAWIGERLGEATPTCCLLDSSIDSTFRTPARRAPGPAHAARPTRGARRALVTLRSDRYVALLDRLVAAPRIPRHRITTTSTRSSSRPRASAMEKLRRAVGALDVDPAAHECASGQAPATPPKRRARHRRDARLAKRIADVQDVLDAPGPGGCRAVRDRLDLRAVRCSSSWRARHRTAARSTVPRGVKRARRKRLRLAVSRTPPTVAPRQHRVRCAASSR